MVFPAGLLRRTVIPWVGLCMIMDITKSSLIQLVLLILILTLNMIPSGNESDY